MRSRSHWSVAVATALMLLWALTYWRLSALEPEFFQLSASGLRGLLFYLGGRHGDAGRVYLTGFRHRLRVDYGDDRTGHMALANGDLTGAEARARTTLLLVPSATEPIVTLGELALDQGRFEEALERFREALTRRPEHIDALYLAALAHARLEQPGTAIDLLNRALRIGIMPARDTILFRVIALAGDLRRRPADTRPACLIAHLYRYVRIFDSGAAALARRYAREAIAKDDRPADAYLTLGVIHDKLGEHEHALRAMEKALEIDPAHAEAYRWLAVEAPYRGDPVLEYRMIRAAFEAAPTDPHYLGHLETVVMGRLGDARLMLGLMQVAVERDPRNVAAHEQLARAAEALGDGRRATTHAKMAEELRQKARADLDRRTYR